MSFSITVDGILHNFTGPVSRENVPSASGVYMVMGTGGVPVYIGEAGDMNERVTNTHHKEGCWKLHGTGNSIRYAKVANHVTRGKVEQRAIEKWDPVCNG